MYLHDDNDATQRANQSQNQGLNADSRITTHIFRDGVKTREITAVVHFIVTDEHEPSRYHFDDDVDDGAASALIIPQKISQLNVLIQFN